MRGLKNGEAVLKIAYRGRAKSGGMPELDWLM